MANDKKEYRIANIIDCSREVRDDGTADLIIEGYAAVYDEVADIGGMFKETIARGAFDGADMRDVPLKYNHADNVYILARTRNKSLTLSVDDHGLKIRAALLDTTDGVDMYKRIKAGLIDKMSFAFTIADDGQRWERSEGGKLRTITKFDRIFDVSVVDMPAYDNTSIYARSKEIADAIEFTDSLENEPRAEVKPKMSAAAEKIILLQGGHV